MPTTDPEEGLRALLGQTAGIRAALLLDAQGTVVAHAERGEPMAPGPLALACHRMVRETRAAADRLAQGPVDQILLDAERATLAILPDEAGRTLCLLLTPEAIPGQALFAARRTLAALPPEA
ncbi:MAG: roadblock/LC7 domain-containing protein [Candidatus Methylomirabilota bacterium]